jgi:hypothetical protein
MARLKSVPLIERRAEVAALAEAEKAHLADCARGNSCEELREIRAELRDWFEPAAGDRGLF